MAVALKHVNQPAPSPREMVPALPPELEAVVLKALAKDPAQRYGDADSFIKDLEVVEAAAAPGPGGRREHGRIRSDGAPATAPTALAPAPAAAAEPPPSARRGGAGASAPAGDRGAAGRAAGRQPPPLARGRAARRRSPSLALLAFLLLGSADKVDGAAGRGADAWSRRAQRVDRAGFDVEVKRRTDQAPRDFVFEQSPNPGQKVDKGSVVTLFVSNGPSTVRVPGRRRPAARRMRGGGCGAPTCGRMSSARARRRSRRGS